MEKQVLRSFCVWVVPQSHGVFSRTDLLQAGLFCRFFDCPDQTPRQHQPAAGRRARRRVGCVHRFASLGRPAAQEGIKALMARGFHKPGDVENRLGYYLGQIAR